MKPVTDASTLVHLGIPALALVVAALFVLAVARTSAGRSAPAVFAALGVAAWMAVTGVLAARGVIAHFERRPPPLFVLVALAAVASVAIARSRLGKRLAGDLPLAVLIGAQGFRLPLELVMHEAAREGIMPVQMTYTGDNFDIVTGASAIVVALLVAVGRAPRWLVAGWNVLGSVLLAVVVTVAVLGTPVLRFFGDDALNTWVTHFPYVWLPTVLVPAALTGHLLIWRRLRNERSVARTTTLAAA